MGKMPALFSRSAIGRSSATISPAARRALVMSDRSQMTDTASPPTVWIACSTSSSLARLRPDEHDVAVLGELECGATADAGCRAGDDPRPGPGWVVGASC